MPNNSSSVVGEIWELFVLLNQSVTFWTNDLVKEQWMKVWSMESFSPRKQHSSSGLIPYLKSSPFVTTVLWINLNWNSQDFKNVNRGINFSCIQMIFSAFAWCILRLFKLKTEGQTTYRKPHWKVKNSRLCLVTLIGLSTTRPRSFAFRLG